MIARIIDILVDVGGGETSRLPKPLCSERTRRPSGFIAPSGPEHYARRY